MCGAELYDKKDIINICKENNYDCEKCIEYMSLKNGNTIKTLKANSEEIAELKSQLEVMKRWYKII